MTAGRGDYIAGGFRSVPDGAADLQIRSVSPRDLDTEVGRFDCRLDHVDAAVEAAREASGGWAATSFAERAERLRELARVFERRRDALVDALARELGKPLWDARSEVKACIAKVGVTLEHGMALVREVEAAGRAARYAFKPHGVGAVLGPFNFPLHLVNGHVVPALATGNTVVIKPSEQTPWLGQLYAECLAEAGLPPGVFNLVQGEGETGARLSAHPDVDFVMFTGSYPVGQRIREATLDQPGKLLALEMGGKNPAVVLADADLDKAVHDVLWGAYVSAGQRCTGTAAALVHQDIFDAFRDHLLAKLDGVRVGDPLREDVFMGPMVSEAARDDYLAALSRAQGEGVEVLRGPGVPEVYPRGAYVGPSVHLVGAPGERAYEKDELFGPDVALIPVRDLEHAIAYANAAEYGLSVSVFTADESRFAHAWERLAYGCVNWNAPTCGASSKLPFGGLRKSGNHRPAALFSTLYCTVPVATLEGAGELDRSGLSPGLRW